MGKGRVTSGEQGSSADLIFVLEHSLAVWRFERREEVEDSLHRRGGGRNRILQRIPRILSQSISNQSSLERGDGSDALTVSRAKSESESASKAVLTKFVCPAPFASSVSAQGREGTLKPSRAAR